MGDDGVGDDGVGDDGDGDDGDGDGDDGVGAVADDDAGGDVGAARAATPQVNAMATTMMRGESMIQKAPGPI